MPFSQRREYAPRRSNSWLDGTKLPISRLSLWVSCSPYSHLRQYFLLYFISSKNARQEMWIDVEYAAIEEGWQNIMEQEKWKMKQKKTHRRKKTSNIRNAFWYQNRLCFRLRLKFGISRASICTCFDTFCQTVYFDTKMPVQQMGKLYAYARVSSQSQRLDRQIRNVLNYLGEDRVLTKLFKEKYTGTKLDRPEF